MSNRVELSIVERFLFAAEKCPYSLDEICQDDWYPGSKKDDPQTEAR